MSMMREEDPVDSSSAIYKTLSDLWTSKLRGVVLSPDFLVPLLSSVAISFFVLDYMPFFPYIAQGAVCLWGSSKAAEFLASIFFSFEGTSISPSVQHVVLQGLVRCTLLYGISLGVSAAPLSALLALLLYQESIRAGVLLAFALIQELPSRWKGSFSQWGPRSYDSPAQLLTQALLYPAFAVVLYFYSAPTIMLGSPPWVNLSVALACSAAAKGIEILSVGVRGIYASRREPAVRRTRMRVMEIWLRLMLCRMLTLKALTVMGVNKAVWMHS